MQLPKPSPGFRINPSVLLCNVFVLSASHHCPYHPTHHRRLLTSNSTCQFCSSMTSLTPREHFYYLYRCILMICGLTDTGDLVLSALMFTGLPLTSEMVNSFELNSFSLHLWERPSEHQKRRYYACLRDDNLAAGCQFCQM